MAPDSGAFDNRQAMRERAAELRAQGWGYVRIARELGTGATTIRRWTRPGYAEHMRDLSREAKRRRTGTCALCGGETRYSGKGGRNGPSLICAACATEAASRTAAERHPCGTHQSFSRGCRCDECRAAYNEYMRLYIRGAA